MKPVVRLLSAITVFLAVLAGGLWVIDTVRHQGKRVIDAISEGRWFSALPPAAPPSLGPTVPYRAAPHPTMAPLDADDLAGLNACANDPDEDPRRRRAAIQLLITHHIRPPSDIARVRAVLKDPRWLDPADIVRLCRASPDNPAYGAQFGVFVTFRDPNGLPVRPLGSVRMVPPCLFIRVSGLPDPTSDDLAALLRGDGAAADLRIEVANYGE